MVDRAGIRKERGVTADVLRVVKWDDRQSYRGDQNTTQKWIKVWRDVNVNPKWQSLTDSQRGQLVMVWVLASERRGEIRAPGGQLEAFVARYCGMTDPLDLSVFEALGLVEIDRCATVATTAVQRSQGPPDNGHSPARTAREEEIRGDQIREEEIEPIDRQPVDRRPAADTEFDAFWSAYPRKIGKGAARKAWARATDRPHVGAMIANIRAHVDSDQWQREGGQFVPHPATWLNQKRWADTPGPTTASIPTELERRNAARVEQLIERGGA